MQWAIAIIALQETDIGLHVKYIKCHKLHCKPIPVMKTGVSCVLFPTGKNLFPSTGNPVMKTGFYLCGKSTQGKPCSGAVLAL